MVPRKHLERRNLCCKLEAKADLRPLRAERKWIEVDSDVHLCVEEETKE